jgi:hypothetical protein
MVSMTIPRAHFGHPSFVAFAPDSTEFFFYRGIDKDPFDFGLFGRCSDESYVGRAPLFTIDIFAVCSNQVEGYNLISLLLA